MNNEQVCTFFVNSKKYNLFACYDSHEDYDTLTVSFYDLYNEDGVCLNEGDPFYEFPDWKSIVDFITSK